MSKVIESTFKLMRATRRRPPRGEHEFPPTVGHLLMILKDNDGASSGELCELLDIRPSSLSELLARVEGHGLIEKKDSAADKRITRTFLTEKGAEAVKQIEENRAKAEEEFSACFTEEEKEQFCALADKLAKHLEDTAPKGECCRHHGPGHHGDPGHCGHHGPHHFHHKF